MNDRTVQTAEWAERALAEAAHHEPASREEQVLERIERARRRRPKITEERVTLAHGAGGKASRTLIEAVFVDAFRNPVLQPLDDGATLDLGTGRLVFTTDAYVVSPLFFPGGDIGDLAVNGTVNDLAVCGARPMYLSAAFVLEEGFPIADLRRITASMADAAERAGVKVVTGDTKVVQRGKADGCYVTTAGVGALERPVTLGESQVRPGDAVIVSGPIGEHGITVLIARGDLDIEADLTSDTAPLHDAVAALLDAVPVRMMRDATRGGVATVLNEVARGAGVAVTVDERALPVRPIVSGACELLGLDPLYVACEGRFVAVVDGDHAEAAVTALRRHPVGEGAAVVGRIDAGPPGMVLLNTAFGGTRIVDLLVGDPLPRIC
ncbi:hydrogenase expression/formation protein HypE [Nonomuraea wenchangensis]|uniref:hydrogenase expression/formation protein HypE n=1 Tax=Nonomuraea wenchangensis TaxID=568860 RepID=UPI0037174C1C